LYSITIGFILLFFFFQAEDGIRDFHVTGVQTCALPISLAGEDFAIPAIMMLGIGGTIVLRGPLGKAIARRIEGMDAPEVDVEPVLQELDEVRARMLELEERMDFTERLLAREREAVALPPAGERRRPDDA